MKPFQFILLYIMLGTLGPVSKGLASGQRAGGGKRTETERREGENDSLGTRRPSHHTWFLSLCHKKICGKKCRKRAWEWVDQSSKDKNLEPVSSP